MDKFVKDIQIRWSDFDPNFHVRHTSYYDWGTMTRVEYFESQGMSLEMMVSEGFGPVLLREECVFKKEIKHGDRIYLELEVLKAKKDFSRWTIQHLVKKEGDILAALITIDGGFIDHKTRKLTVPSERVIAAFNAMPRSPSFSWID